MLRRVLLTCFYTGAALLVVACTSTSSSAQSKPTLRVLSYNVHHCRGLDEKVDLPRIAKIVTDCNPDLVALQEIDHQARRSGSVAQATELAKLTEMHGLFFKAIDFDGGEYGQAILSKTPLREPQTVKLPNRPGREQRIVGWAMTEIHGQTFRFGTTHLDHADQAIRLEQAQEISGSLSNTPMLTIIAGDFNANPDSKEIVELSKVLSFAKSDRLTASFPAEKPTKQIDFIGFASNPSGTAPGVHVPLRVISFEVLDQPLASDHRPILAIFELATP